MCTRAQTHRQAAHTIMEAPNYGRTGLLTSLLGGLPVTRPRLLVPGNPAATRPVKWYPSLLTIPQQLLDALRREDSGEGVDDGVSGTTTSLSSDPTLITYLRVATIAESLVQWWRCWAAKASPQSTTAVPAPKSPSREQLSALYTAILQWCRDDVASGKTVPASAPALGSSSQSTFFIPTYKLLVMKDDRKVMEYANLTWRSVWLLGKEPEVNDVLLEHPSCSSQHASMEMRFVLADEAAFNAYVEERVNAMQSDAPQLPSPRADVPLFAQSKQALQSLCSSMWAMLEETLTSAGGDASVVWTAELQLIDLESTNHTKLNGEVVSAMEATTVIESDVLEFGCSSRKYVVMRTS
ncbi:FHA domain containing protein, putative [Leishmania lindenbergi]|uniref:FHA domain containing protein n=1 Tax=Leishmania lindenbergi TaxID=651832 RepID=A0AAW3A3W8_9TRYP